MGFGKPPGVPCPPNNPHCQGLEPVGASIENYVLALLAFFLISIYVYFRIYPKHRFIVSSYLKSKLLFKDDDILVKFIWVCMALGFILWALLVIYIVKKSL